MSWPWTEYTDRDLSDALAARELGDEPTYPYEPDDPEDED